MLHSQAVFLLSQEPGDWNKGACSAFPGLMPSTKLWSRFAVQVICAAEGLDSAARHTTGG